MTTKNKKVVKGPPISAGFKKVCAGCDKVQAKSYDTFHKHINGKEYCNRCYEEIMGTSKGKEQRVIALSWDEGDCKEYFITDAPKSAILTAIKATQDVKDYTTEDFVAYLWKDYFIEQIEIEYYNNF